MLFRLHYQLTVTILAALSLFTMSRQFFADPIDCHFEKLPRALLNTHCYIHSTFLVERNLTDKLDGKVPLLGFSEDIPKDSLKFYGYYQWISIALSLQATSLYIPHHVWKCCEGGKIKLLAGELVAAVLTEDGLDQNVTSLIDYFRSRLHSHNRWAFRYMTCELLNVIITVGQICLMNIFLGKDFQFYGIDVMLFNQQPEENSENPMELLFPTVTMCTAVKNVTAGIAENMNGICILSQNSTNQKMFVFLWFWCHILATVGVFFTIYRIITLFSSSLRYYEFRFNCKMNNLCDIHVVYKNLWIGDWFLLKMLQMNLNPLAYKELIYRMAQEFEPCYCSECLQYLPITRVTSV